MPRVTGDTNYAENALYAHSFTDKVYAIDLTNDLLDDRTVTDAELVAQENDADPAADALTIDGIAANAGAITVRRSDGTEYTIEAGKSISARITGGETATYQITFSYTDSEGEVDGKTVTLEVRG